MGYADTLRKSKVAAGQEEIGTGASVDLSAAPGPVPLIGDCQE